MRRDTFIETGHVTALRAAVESALEAGIGYPSIVMAYGEAGTGKTVSARKMYVEVGGYYLRALEGMSQAAFLQDLCFEVTGMRPHRCAASKREIIKHLEEEPAPIFIDEVDRLHISRMEDLRDINDLTGSPVIFIGEMGLPQRVHARSRINDRIPEPYRIHFGKVDTKDIMIFAQQAAAINLAPDAAKVVQNATKGNFRRIHNAILTLENAAKASGVKEVSADMASKILAKSKGGRNGQN